MPATSWAKELRECERLLASPPTRGTWLRRAYVRIYRFLLSQYGDRAAESTPDESSMPFVDATGALEGKAARSPGEIQHTLKEIHAAQPEQRQRESKSKPIDEAWITVAQRHERFRFDVCQKMLATHGIPTRLLKGGGHVQLQVPGGYRQEAFLLIEAAREDLRVPPRQVFKRRHMIGARISVVASLSAFILGWVIVALAFGVDTTVVVRATCAAVGAMIVLLSTLLLTGWLAEKAVRDAPRIRAPRR